MAGRTRVRMSLAAGSVFTLILLILCERSGDSAGSRARPSSVPQRLTHWNPERTGALPRLRSADSSVRFDAGIALLADPHLTAELPALLLLLSDPRTPADVRQFLEAAIGKSGSSAVAPLTALLTHSSPIVQASALRALGLVGPAAAVSLPTIVGLMGSASSTVRDATVAAIRGIGSSALPALTLALSSPDVPAAILVRAIAALGKDSAISMAIALSSGSDPLARSRAGLALYELGRNAAPAAETLLCSLGDTSQDRETILRILKEIEQLPPDAAQVLQGFVDDTLRSPAVAPANAEAVLSAIELLGSLGSRARTAEPCLWELCEHGAANVRAEALAALCAVSSNTSGVTNAIVRELRHVDDNGMWGLLQALRRQAARIDIAAVLAGLREHNAPQAALEFLLGIGDDGVDSLRLSVQSMDVAELRELSARGGDGVSPAARRIVSAACRNRGVALAESWSEPTVSDLLTSKRATDVFRGLQLSYYRGVSEEERSIVVEAIRRELRSGGDLVVEATLAVVSLGEGAADAVPELMGLLDDPTHCARAARALGAIGAAASPSAGRIRMQLKNGDADVRAAARVALYAITGDEHVLIEGLEDVAPTVRIAVVEALGGCGSHAITYLEEYCRSDRVDMRLAAAKALSAIAAGDGRAREILRAMWLDPSEDEYVREVARRACGS